MSVIFRPTLQTHMREACSPERKDEEDLAGFGVDFLYSPLILGLPSDFGGFRKGSGSDTELMGGTRS